jgi:hypothetical protein
MMGQQTRNESLVYYFRPLEEQIPKDHLLRQIDRYIDLSFVREKFESSKRWSDMPSPCRPHPCHPRRVFQRCGSARWFG